MKTLILGLGNTILTDDGIGIHVVRAVAGRCPDGVDLAESSAGGLRLLDLVAGYERVILVDALRAAEGRPGDVHVLRMDSLCVSEHSDCTHDLTLPGALALGRKLGMALPADQNIAIVAIQAEDVTTFGERCTPAVEAAIPRAVEAVLEEVEGASPKPPEPLNPGGLLASCPLLL